MKYEHLVVMRDAACSKFLANYIEWHNFKKWWNEFKTYDTVPQKIKAFSRATKDGILPVSKRVSQPPPSVLRMMDEVDPSSDVDTAAAVETQHDAIKTALGNGRYILAGIVQPFTDVPTAMLPPTPIDEAVKTPRSSQTPTDDDKTQEDSPPRPSAPHPVIARSSLAPVPPNFSPPDTPIDPTEEEEGPFIHSLPSMSPVLSSRTLFPNKSAEQTGSIDRDSVSSEPIIKVEPTGPTRVLHSNVPISRRPSSPLEMYSPSDSEQGPSSLLGKRKLELTADVTMAGSPETPKDLELRRKKQRFNEVRALGTKTEQRPSAPEDPYAKYKGRGRYAQSAKKSVFVTQPKPLQLTNEHT